MNRSELNVYFKDKLEQFSKIDSRIAELSRKLKEVKSMESDSLIQINMGICIFSVSKDKAQEMLSDAIQVEHEYHHLLQERFHKAVGVMNGD